VHYSPVILCLVYLVTQRVEVGLQQLILQSFNIDDVFHFFGFVQERLFNVDGQVDLVVWTVQVLINDLSVLLLSAKHDVIQLRVLAIVL